MTDHAHCRDLLGHLSDYLDGDAETSLCAEIERHLATCPDCQVVVDTLAKTISLYRDLPPAVPPPDASAASLARVTT